MRHVNKTFIDSRGVWFAYVTAPYQELSDLLNKHYVDADSLRVTYIEDNRVCVVFRGNKKTDTEQKGEVDG